MKKITYYQRISLCLLSIALGFFGIINGVNVGGKGVSAIVLATMPKPIIVQIVMSGLLVILGIYLLITKKKNK